MPLTRSERARSCLCIANMPLALVSILDFRRFVGGHEARTLTSRRIADAVSRSSCTDPEGGGRNAKVREARKGSMRRPRNATSSLVGVSLF